MSAKENIMSSSPRSKDAKINGEKVRKEQQSESPGDNELHVLSSLAPSSLDTAAVAHILKSSAPMSPSKKNAARNAEDGPVTATHSNGLHHDAAPVTVSAHKRAAPDEDEDLSYMEAAANLALLRDASPRTAQKATVPKRTPKGKGGSTTTKTPPASATRSGGRPAAQRKAPLWPTVETSTGSRVPIEGVATIAHAENVSMYTLLRAQMNPPAAVHRMRDESLAPPLPTDGIPHTGYKPLRQPLPPPPSTNTKGPFEPTNASSEELLRELVGRGKRVREWWRVARLENRGEPSAT